MRAENNSLTLAEIESWNLYHTTYWSRAPDSWGSLSDWDIYFIEKFPGCDKDEAHRSLGLELSILLKKLPSGGFRYSHANALKRALEDSDNDKANILLWEHLAKLESLAILDRIHDRTIKSITKQEEIGRAEAQILEKSKKRARITKQEEEITAQEDFENTVAQEGTTKDDVLNSVAESSDTFGKVKFPTYYEKLKSIWHTKDAEANYYVIDLGDNEIRNQVHELLSENELILLSKRLRLIDENECVSAETFRYLTLFDEIVKCDHGDMEEKNNAITDERNGEELEKVITKMEEKVHQIDSLPEKFHYLANTFPIPAENYDQSKMPDIFIVKSVSSHLDTITKTNGIMNTPERTWTAHVLAYLFFVTFCFIDSLQYFSCERNISTKIDAQENGYKADGILEFFERPKQIPLFLLEVSESPNNPDPDKINGDRKKLMNEGVFALNKFLTSTELPKWKVCEALGIFLAQGFANQVEIGQIIFIGPGLYLFSPFTSPALIIPTSITHLGHAPRLIRALLCLRYNIIKKVKKFKKFAEEGQQCIAMPRTKYATGLTPERSKL